MSADKNTIELPRDVVLAWRRQYSASVRNDKGVYPEDMALAVTIDAARWEPPVATIPWVSVEDHPHPMP